MNTTPYLPEIDEAVHSHAFLCLADAVRGLTYMDLINGPCGRLIGKRLMEVLDAKQCQVEDLTVREVVALVDAARDEYNENARRWMER